MKIISRNCLHCEKQFNALNKEVKRGGAKFCGLQCSAEYHGKNRPKPEPNVTCAWCENKFYKQYSRQTQIHSKSGLFFCNRKCKAQAQKIGGIAAIKPAHYSTSKSYRDIAFRVKPKVCERCGFDKEAAITVHHKDWNHDNNVIENLEVLCWNCHAIEHFAQSFTLP